MTTSASAPSTSPQKSPIGCTSSLYHFAHLFHFARSESTKREPTAESSEANIAAPRRPWDGVFVFLRLGLMLCSGK